MHAFHSNIISIYREKGKAWLDELPELMALDKDWAIHDAYLKKSRKLRDQLLQTSEADVFLHGDLHHDNIFCNPAMIGR